MKSKSVLYSLEETIDRPIDITVSNDFKELIGLRYGKHDIYTTFDSEDHTVMENGGLTGKRNTNKMVEEYMVVTATEEGEENQSSVLAPERLRQGEIFKDYETGVSISALRYFKHRHLTLTYYTKSKTKAIALIEKLRTCDIMNYGRKRHKIEYHFDIPYGVTRFLSHVNGLRNKRLEPEERLDIVDYVIKFSNQLISRKNVSGNLPYKYNLAVREHQYDVQGVLMDDTYTLQKEKGENGYWYITFSYDIWYQKPTMLLLDYPILIWNTPIDFKYTKVVARPVAQIPVKGRPDPVWYGLYHLGKPYTEMLPYNWQTAISIPAVDKFDNWPNDGIYQDICSFLIMVDDKDRYNLLNIKHLPQVTLRSSFLRYLLEFPETISESRCGLFHFLLYRNGERDYKNPIVLDKDGNLTTEFPMQIKSTYRVIIRIVKDLDYIHLANLKELDKYMVEEHRKYLALLDCIPDAKGPKENPHYKKPVWYVDEYGNIVDEEGYIVYTNGERIVEYVCPDGHEN